jgi:hypothetical protein
MEDTTPQKDGRGCFILACILALVLGWFGYRCWWGFDLLLHEGRVPALVESVSPHSSVVYHYAVNGVSYTGHDYGGHATGTPIRAGGTIEIRYSMTHPSHSAISDPLLFPKQVLFGLAFVAVILVLIMRGGDRKEGTKAMRHRERDRGAKER